MNLFLSIILLLLLIVIAGKRGLKAFLTIYINLALVFILIIIIGWGFNPLIHAFIIGLIISLVILFMLNGFNKKTISSFISVFILLLIFIIVTILVSKRIYMHGYSEESIVSVVYLNYNCGIDMMSLFSAVVIIGLLGNIVDTSIAISSALFEVYDNNKHLTKKELFISGMNIGKDILGTTTNTLFFAYLGGFMTLILFFIDRSFTFSNIINSKIFSIEFTRIILSGMASFIIIPLTSIVTSILLTHIKKDLE